MTTQTGRSFADDPPQGPHVGGRSSRGQLGRKLEIVERLERQAAGRQMRRAIDCSAARPDSPERNSTRPGSATGNWPRNGVPLASEINRSAVSDVLSVLNAPKMPPGCAGRQNAGDQVASLELARVELGGGEEWEPVFIGSLGEVEVITNVVEFMSPRGLISGQPTQPSRDPSHMTVSVGIGRLAPNLADHLLPSLVPGPAELRQVDAGAILGPARSPSNTGQTCAVATRVEWSRVVGCGQPAVGFGPSALKYGHVIIISRLIGRSRGVIAYLESAPEWRGVAGGALRRGKPRNLQGKRPRWPSRDRREHRRRKSLRLAAKVGLLAGELPPIAVGLFIADREISYCALLPPNTPTCGTGHGCRMDVHSLHCRFAALSVGLSGMGARWFIERFDARLLSRDSSERPLGAATRMRRYASVGATRWIVLTIVLQSASSRAVAGQSLLETSFANRSELPQTLVHKR